MAEFGEFANAMLALWLRVRTADALSGRQDVSAERFRLAYETGFWPTALGYEGDEVFEAMCVAADIFNTDGLT
jgi:hypothetical protein